MYHHNNELWYFLHLLGILVLAERIPTKFLPVWLWFEAGVNVVLFLGDFLVGDFRIPDLKKCAYGYKIKRNKHKFNNNCLIQMYIKGATDRCQTRALLSYTPARWSWTIHDFPLNDSWIIFMKCSWKVHEDPMNLLLDILKSWIFVHEKMLMNIHEHTFSWIIHEQLYSWSFIIWWMSNNKFIGSSWTVHE